MCQAQQTRSTLAFRLDLRAEYISNANSPCTRSHDVGIACFGE
jgi:hypothetical protein